MQLLRRIGWFTAAIAALASAQLALQAVRGEPGQFFRLIDEPSHFTTAAMIRDYAVHGAPGNPVAFAKNYYLHYPKVAFGSWPPLFHLMLGAWMIIAPVTRASAVAYVDVLTACVAVVAFLMARRSLPAPLAASVAIAAWLAPTPQHLARIVQADTQYALFSALAVFLFADYAAKPARRRAVFFGLAFFAALMTKNNALFLPVSCAIVLATGRNWAVLRRLELWLAALPGVVAMALWQWWTFPFVRNNMAGVTEHSTPVLTLGTYTVMLLTLIWPGLVLAALYGMTLCAITPWLRRKQVEPAHAASLGLLIGPCIFHSLLPHGVNQRYLYPSLIPLLIFAAHGAWALLAARPLIRLAPAVRTLLACALVAAPALAARTQPLPASHYAGAAAAIASGRPPFDAPAALIVSSFSDEGILISEVLVREPRPGHWLLRGIKLLRRQTGVLNRQTAMIDASPEEMLRYFQSLPIGLVVIADEGDGEASEQIAYTRSLIAAHPDEFSRVFDTPIGQACRAGSCSIEIYRLKDTAAGPFAPGRLPKDMPIWKGL